MARTFARVPLGMLAAAVVGCAAATGCGPLRLDTSSHLRGGVVEVAPDAVTVRHKSGRTYRLPVTAGTRIVREGEPGGTMADVCPSQRAHAVLGEAGGPSVAELRVSGACGR